MSRKKQTKLLVLIALLLALLVGFAGVGYSVLTKQTTELHHELEAVRAQRDALHARISELQTGIDEKEAWLSAAEAEAQEKIQEEKEKAIPAKGLIAIDPGHQGSWVNMSALEANAPGSSEMKRKATTGTEGSFTGIPEFELNLDISLMLAEELRNRGYEVILAREDNDTAISNAERAVKANEAGADFAIRIHANGSDNSGANGALTMVGSPDNPYIGHLYEKSAELAEDVLTSYCAATGLANDGMLLADNMTGLNWSTIPSMILEMGFMTNQSDDTKMADSGFRQRMVQGIADGIDIYYSKYPTSYRGMIAAGKNTEDFTLQRSIDDIRARKVAEAENAGEIWAVSVKNLKGGSTADFNGDVKMRSASVMKLFIMAAVYDRVCYPSSEERYIPFPEEYEGELKDLITRMITVSDNEASNEIVTRLGGGDFETGMQVVNGFCSENGYRNTSMGRRFLDNTATNDNFTSANDCMRLAASLYDGTCVNPEASAKMLEYMKNQTRRNKIPAGVNGAQTANKTGEVSGDGLGYAENDVAVVWGNTADYVICVLSGELKWGNQAAVDRIVDISSEVYNAMEA